MSRTSLFKGPGLVLALSLTTCLTACDRGTTQVEDDPDATPALATDWFDHVNWDEKTIVTVNMIESD